MVVRAEAVVGLHRRPQFLPPVALGSLELQDILQAEPVSVADPDVAEPDLGWPG
jgi:hypothetical protein